MCHISADFAQTGRLNLYIQPLKNNKVDVFIVSRWAFHFYLNNLHIIVFLVQNLCLTAFYCCLEVNRGL